MAERALKRYLTELLDRLGRKQQNERYTFGDIALKAKVSRTTLYNWMRGKATPTEENLVHLAAGIRELLTAAAENAEVGTIPNSDKLVTELRGLLEREDISPGRIEVGYFAYDPICALPPPNGAVGSEGSSFLGELVASFFLAAYGQDEISEKPCDVLTLTDVECDVIVGLFPSPERIRSWDFIRTPIQVPLNGVMLRRDVDRFLREVLSGRRKRLADRGVDGYVSALGGAVWRSSETDGMAPSLRDELAPITADEEAGREHLLRWHGFPKDQLEKDEPSEVDAAGFQTTLLRASTTFEALAGRGAGHPPARLPIVFADELTVLEVARRLENDPESARLSDPVLLHTSVHANQVLDLRPRHSVSIGVRRERSADRGPRILDQTDLRRGLEEFCWSRAGFIADRYVALYRHLTGRYSGTIGPVAARYFLTWLSIQISDEEIQSGISATGNVARSAPPGTEAWTPVLEASKAAILASSDLRDLLLASLEPAVNHSARARI